MNAPFWICLLTPAPEVQHQRGQNPAILEGFGRHEVRSITLYVGGHDRIPGTVRKGLRLAAVEPDHVALQFIYAGHYSRKYCSTVVPSGARPSSQRKVDNDDNLEGNFPRSGTKWKREQP